MLRRSASFLAISALLACGQQRAGAPEKIFATRNPSPVALFTNGGFESGNLGSWTVTTNRNTGITYPPQSVADLNLKNGGSALSFARTGTTEQTIPAGLSAASTLRFPKYGSWSAVVNEQGAGQNVNT